MVTALYRRYRPENFAELIGQNQVTDPLMSALRSNRVGHAYLFSGPRGCGKTTSARILARCLNCAEGPTDTPCGVCPSCVELGRDGGGSLDVVEIDAASHNGVDDARDLRERAIFAPARDRYKIFILDEAHMVTPQGFNALLKIVEEPPEHVKFIFATTEPEKVIGTIRSRTHHYPFRLVPPAQMLDYVQQLCESESVEVAPGVLPLVVRAGGGSVRDTLSLLDQLINGSDGPTVEYERAVALLGYTHGALLDEVIDSLSARDAGGAFAAVDRVIQTGQDPRRFVEDLLERLRDLIIVAATSAEGAAAVLRGVPQDELDAMQVQASKFGPTELSRAADVANAALTEMTGATSPRLHLELLIARIMVPASDDTHRGALARVERLERRVGVAGPDASAPQPAAVPEPATPRPVEPAPSRPVEPAPPSPVESAAPRPAEPEPVREPSPAPKPTPVPEPARVPESAPAPEPAPVPESSSGPAAAVAPVTLQQLKDSWPQVVEVVQKAKRRAWMVAVTATPRALTEDYVLTLTFPSQNDADSFKQRSAPGDGVSDYLRNAIQEVLGIRVKFIARVDGPPPAASAPSGGATGGAATGGKTGGTGAGAAAAPQRSGSRRPASGSGATAPAAAASAGAPSPASGSSSPASSAPASSGGWATVAIPGSGGAADSAAPADRSATPPVRGVAAAIADAAPDGPPPYEGLPSDLDAPEPDEPEPDWVREPEPDTFPPTAASTAAPSAAPSARTPSNPSAGGAGGGGGNGGRGSAGERQRYGEAVVREILGANFIEERPVTRPNRPSIRPTGEGA
ncbi:DNA polymerase III subunit gamma and tau [Planctomonas deserti]|uniref:DNA polymerase III subunit gamma and tau n=1 Tax=Planctomonas deserti TaxID=2144185 RepID=UPI000D33FA15|nr:DNA polymerase III subunit gamma and tau [Planctomonas deserti]